MDQMFDYIGKFIKLIRISDIVDIAIVAILIYQLLKMIKETRALQLVKGIAIIFVVMQISAWTNLTSINYILKSVMQVGLFSIVVIFQPELRTMLERMGRSKVGKIINFNGNQSEDIQYDKIIDEIVTATVNLSRTKTGALMVLEREIKLGDITNSGTILNAEVTSSLLENIFVPNTPLHDGAVIIRGDKIHTAGCLLPLTSNVNLSRELGTRHRAALGMSELSDAMIIIVSEETGKISYALNGNLTRNLNDGTLKNAIERVLKPRERAYELEKVKFWKGVQNEKNK